MLFRIRNRSQLDKIIITAMDRFVWFVLLVVMSHLVTEFTRVTGYARGNRNELMLVNDTLIEPRSIQNMLLYPGQQDYASPPFYYQNGNAINNYPHPQTYNGINNMQLQQQQQQLQQQKPNGQIVIAPSNAQQGFTFSFRPLIDSIFEIPISTLRAVNNLVARLTGSYQATPATYLPQKSAAAVVETERSNLLSTVDAAKATQTKRTSLREETE